jgi:signal transduction histidine kinase
MSAEALSRFVGARAGWLALGVGVSAATLVWFGYRATSEWQHNAASLANRRAVETAELFVTAITRDMRGVQQSVLASASWDAFALDSAYDVRTLAATAFARYPYPESFFAWRASPAPCRFVFLNRTDRRPSWMLGGLGPNAFPVLIGYDSSLQQSLLTRIQEDAVQGRRFSIFEMSVGTVPYQVVTRLLYGGAFRAELVGAFGFTVNLQWVRRHYFSDLASEIRRISTTASAPTLAIVDARGTYVTGKPFDPSKGELVRRSFPFLFFDPLLVAVAKPGDLSSESWAVEVSAGGDPALSRAVRGASRILGIAALAASLLGLGLVLSVRVSRASARLAEARSDFVATVTHEIRTPIATIRAIGDTLVSGRVSDSQGLKDYAQMLVQEARRLTLLVDNLLAYARITDVADIYFFEPTDLHSLVKETLGGFRAQLEQGRFEVLADIPVDIVEVRGDHTALRLMLDNLVDNAVRYSAKEHWLQVSARSQGGFVVLDIGDHGVGIAADEIDRVVRKYCRGRRGAGMDGSGLGLAISRRIAEDHGGRLSIRSDIDAGTTISVALPAHDLSHDETNSNS